MRHACNTCSMNSAGELTGSASDTISNKTKQVQGETTANIILADPQNTNVGQCALLLLLSQEQSHHWDDASKDAYCVNPEISSDADLENRTQVKKHICT